MILTMFVLDVLMENLTENLSLALATQNIARWN